MSKAKIFACLLVVCVFFAIEDRQLLAQATSIPQPGVAVTPGSGTNAGANNKPGVVSTGATSGPTTVATTGATSGVATTNTSPLPPSVYGNPFNTQASGGAGSAKSAAGSGSAPALGDDPCSSSIGDVGSIVFEPDPLGMAPGGSADSLSPPTSDLRPANPVIKKCEGGRIIVRVENKRFYAYHIGDEILISVTILADDGVQLNLTSLNQQVLGFEGSDFLMVPVRVVSVASRPYSGRPNSTIYGIQLSVQTFVTKPLLVFNLDLKYAIDVPPGVTQPNWRILTTPDFVITNSPVITTNSDDELEEGDLRPADFRSSWVEWPLMVGGLFIVVWFGFLRRLIVRFNRARPGRIVSAEEKAWNVFDKVFSDAKVYGEFTPQYVRNVDGALRIYLAQSLKANMESLTAKQIDALLTGDPSLLINANAHDDSSPLPGGSAAGWQRLIVSALRKCESVIYARADQPIRLTELEADELFAELKQLVPQPEI